MNNLTFVDGDIVVATKNILYEGYNCGTIPEGTVGTIWYDSTWGTFVNWKDYNVVYMREDDLGLVLNPELVLKKK